VSDPFATVFAMQSERMRQRKRERKRLERDEKRSEADAPIRIDELDILVPRRVGILLEAALRKARKEAGRPITRGEGLVRIAQHYIDKWGPVIEAVERRGERLPRH